MSAGVWTLPNLLTGVRLLVVPALAWVLLAAGSTPAGRRTALLLFAAASVTDLVDGWLARRRGECTDLGALVDPIADKALVGTALVCLSVLGILPWWVTGVVLARELAVTGLRLVVLRSGVIPASRGGKLKTVAQTVLVVVALAAPEWTVLLWAAAGLTVVATVVTGVDYAVRAVAQGARRAGDENRTRTVSLGS